MAKLPRTKTHAQAVPSTQELLQALEQDFTLDELQALLHLIKHSILTGATDFDPRKREMLIILATGLCDLAVDRRSKHCAELFRVEQSARGLLKEMQHA